MKIFKSKCENDTLEIASAFAENLKGGDIVAFSGGMGMGKTVFVRGAANALGLDVNVSSPTFAIVNDYGTANDIHVYHFDMYRVETWDSLYSTGYFDYLNDNSILFIEWSENIDNVLSESVIHVDFERTENDDERIIKIYGDDSRW